MLTLMEGGFCSVCHEQLVKKIQSSVLSGRRSLLIVPEQQTLSCEAQMCALLPEYAPRVFEVTNFTRLSDVVFREIGGVNMKYATGTESSLIMWQTLVELSGVISLTGGRKKVNTGTVTKALSAASEMERVGISPEMLTTLVASGRITDRRLYAKLFDLSQIWTAYRERLREKTGEVTDGTAALIDRLSENREFFSGTDIFIDGFISFTEPQYRLIILLSELTDVTLTLTLPRYAGEDYGDAGFEYSEVVDSRERLIRLAGRAGVTVRQEKQHAETESKNIAIRAITPLLFSTSGECCEDALRNITTGGGRVRIFEAQTPFDECDFIAADIKRRVISGERYSDIAIVTRNIDAYCDILDNALKLAGVPHFISLKRDISSLEAIKLITTAYATVCRGFRSEDVLTYAKCGLSGVSRDELDEWELYIKRWSIDGRGFTREEGWNMSPRGYKPLDEEDFIALEGLNRTRDRIIAPLLAFDEDSLAAATVREHAEALMRLLSDISLEKCLYARAQELFDAGEVEAAEENARLWQTICRSLDTLVSVLGDTPCDRDDFISQLGVVFRDASISRLPSAREQVTVGEADTLRMGRKRHIYLIGVNQGKFPGVAREKSYFTERDKAYLSALGMPIEPDMRLKSSRELYCFARAFSFPDQSVTLSYPTMSAAMSRETPAEVIGRIVELASGRVTVRKINELPLGERIFSPHNALMLSGEAADEEYGEIKCALIDHGLAHTVEIAEGSTKNVSLSLSARTVAMVFGENTYLSQSRLDSFLSCPFSYYSKYILSLGEERRSELSADVVGSFIHSVLENFFSIVWGELGGIESVGEEDIASIAERASEKYLSLILGGGGGARMENATSRLTRAAMPVIKGLCEEFSSCKYTPTFFELKTGTGRPDSPDPIVFVTRDGGRVVISGIVDRVDTMKVGEDVYVRVIDYKSGSKTFSPSDLEKGESLQMFLYLKSITDTKRPEFLEKMGVGEGGELIPAAVMYVKTRLSDSVIDTHDEAKAEEAAKALCSRDGMLLDDAVSLEGMNGQFLPEGADKPDSNRRYTREGWARICETVESVVLEIAENMRSGDISARPKNPSDYRGTCSYCPYRPVCRRK